jgi:hypothetical protein
MVVLAIASNKKLLSPRSFYTLLKYSGLSTGSTPATANKTHYFKKRFLLSVTSLTKPAFAVVKLNHSSLFRPDYRGSNSRRMLIRRLRNALLRILYKSNG